MRFFFFVLVVLCGCRDAEAERFAHARATYDTLLAKGERVESKAFDPVLADFDAVPEQSAHAAEARRLSTAIRKGRQHALPPLAVVPKGGSRPPMLEAEMAACARLAELAGLDGGVDRRALTALEACRRRVEQLDERLNHADDPADAADGGQAP